MKTSKIDNLITKIENEGLKIKGIHNCITSDVKTTTIKAELYFNQYLQGEKNYILGMVPAETEFLENLDYLITFNAIERYTPYGVDKETYNNLHDEASKLLNGFDTSNFINTVKNWKMDNDLKNRIFSDINDYKKGIMEELREILDYMEMLELDYIMNENKRKNNPWYIGLNPYQLITQLKFMTYPIKDRKGYEKWFKEVQEIKEKVSLIKSAYYKINDNVFDMWEKCLFDINTLYNSVLSNMKNN